MTYSVVGTVLPSPNLLNTTLPHYENVCKCAQVGAVDNAYLAYTRCPWYKGYMAKLKREKATATIRIYPSTRRTLNIKAAQEGLTLAQIVELLSRIKLERYATNSSKQD